MRFWNLPQYMQASATRERPHRGGTFIRMPGSRPHFLNDLLVRANRLPGHPAVPAFGGTVTLKESGGLS